MPDYKALYFQLMGRIADIIETLQEVQQEAEDTYIEELQDKIKNIPAYRDKDT